MEFLNDYWGINENLSPLEAAARGIVMFLIALLIIRLAGVRPFGKEDAMDTVVTILIGAVMGRAVVGASPFFSVVGATIAIVLLHKILSRFAFYRPLEKALKGRSSLLYKDGQFLHRNLRRADLTETDVLEELRLELHTDKLEGVSEIYMEKTGEISFVMKKYS